LIKKVLNLGRFEKIDCVECYILLISQLFVHYAVSLLDTVIADMPFEAGNKHIDLFLGSAAK
jgi:hypothetical protein